MNDLRNKVINCALGFVGVNEADGTHKRIIDTYNKINPLPRGYHMKYSDPWCAAFVSAVAKLAGTLDIMPPECSCDAMIEKYKAAGRWIERDDYAAKPGDVIFYDWQDSGEGDDTGSADHVGIITAATHDGFDVVEGNYSDAVKIRHIARNGRYIRGFGIPDYGESENGGEAPVDPDTVIVDYPVYLVHMPLLKIGDSGDVVKAAQLLLIGRGYYCGPYGADGDFGKGTLAGVKNFQAANGLEVDGEIGGLTWSALLGVVM